MAIGVEVLRHIPVHQDGLTNSVIRSCNSQITHLLYTVVIVAASQPVVALWASVFLAKTRRRRGALA